MKYVILCLALSSCASSPKTFAPLAANPDYGVLSGATADVVVIPQWHLSAQTNTRISSANLPQSENQRAIYRQLSDWSESGAIKTVIVEGCEGEITDGFQERFNGWTLPELQQLTAEALDGAMTHVGLKLKAKLGNKVKVVCGDSNELIKRHQLILSDLRGFVGFKIRIEEFSSDVKKRADYVATVRELMKMPTTSDDVDVLQELDQRLRNKLVEFNTVLLERNASFVAASKAATPPEAVVIGAIHVDDLLKQLSEAKLKAVTLTPKGLKGDEAQLLGDIQALLAKPKR